MYLSIAPGSLFSVHFNNILQHLHTRFYPEPAIKVSSPSRLFPMRGMNGSVYSARLYGGSNGNGVAVKAIQYSAYMHAVDIHIIHKT